MSPPKSVELYAKPRLVCVWEALSTDVISWLATTFLARLTLVMPRHDSALPNALSKTDIWFNL